MGWVKSSRVLSIPTPVLFEYMTDKTQSEIGLERELIQKTSDNEYHMFLFGAFLRCVQYGPIDCLSYPQMVLLVKVTVHCYTYH